MWECLPLNAPLPEQRGGVRWHLAVEQNLIRLTSIQHGCKALPECIFRVAVHPGAQGTDRHCTALAEPVKAPAVAVRTRPSGGLNAADAFALQQGRQKLVAVVVPALDWSWKIGVKGESRAEHQWETGQCIEVPLRLPPEALELVVVEEEVHACILRVPAGQQLVEADQVIDPKGQRQGFSDGVARRGQLEAVQQEPVHQLARPHPLVRKTHALSSCVLSRRA